MTYCFNSFVTLTRIIAHPWSLKWSLRGWINFFFLLLFMTTNIDDATIFVRTKIKGAIFPRYWSYIATFWNLCMYSCSSNSWHMKIFVCSRFTLVCPIKQPNAISILMVIWMATIQPLRWLNMTWLNIKGWLYSQETPVLLNRLSYIFMIMMRKKNCPSFQFVPCTYWFFGVTKFINKPKSYKT